MARGKKEYWASAEGLRQLEAWTEEKLTDVQIASNIGIARSTLGEWKKKNPQIADALDFSEEKANRKKFEYWMSPDGMLLVRAWARDGYTDEELATKLGIVRSTLNAWKIKFPEFAELLTRTKEIVDVEAENTLIKIMHGHSYTEQTAIKVKTEWYDPDTGRKTLTTEEVIVVDLQKWQPADVKSLIFFLKNRGPKRWREKQVIEVSDLHKSGIKFTFEQLPGVVESEEEIMG